jgi:alpha-mannosidase
MKLERSCRNPEKVLFEITSYITLKKGSKFLEIRTELNNQIRDHKLGIMFPSGYKNIDKSYSETHFDVTERDIHLPDTSTWKEPMLCHIIPNICLVVWRMEKADWQY